MSNGKRSASARPVAMSRAATMTYPGAMPAEGEATTLVSGGAITGSGTEAEGGTKGRSPKRRSGVKSRALVVNRTEEVGTSEAETPASDSTVISIGAGSDGAHMAPVPKRAPQRAAVPWSAEREAMFLETLAQTCSVKNAIRASGLSSAAIYAAGGGSVRDAIEALTAAFPLPLSDDGDVLRLGDAGISAIEADETGTSADDTRAGRIVRDRRAAGALPDGVTIGYYEPGRDYQAGSQSALRNGVAVRSERIELPAAIGAGTAKGLAEAALARAWRERERAIVRLPWRRIGLRPGQHVELDGARWRITDWTLEHMTLELGLIRSGPAAIAVEASPGRSTGGMDAPAGETRIELLDIPGIGGDGGTAPRLWLAAAGTGAGWRRGVVSLSLDDGANWRTLGMTAPAATMGTAIDALDGGPRELIDRMATIEVALLHDGMMLPGGGEAALIAGRNLALIGDEILAFADATQTAPGRWRISGLLRGRFGTDWAIDRHRAGERFVLLEEGLLLPVDLPATTLGGPIAVSVSGTGDAGPPATREAHVIGRGIRPPNPVAFTARRLGDGTIRIGWIRRSRTGWAWLDGADVPLGEDSEQYRLTLASGGTERVIELGMRGFDYAAHEQPAGLLAGVDALTVTVAQIGRFGPSVPAAMRTFTL